MNCQSKNNNKALLAPITDMKRFSTHDGPGIRTMVFFKGCPLRCQWCQNPETWSTVPELMYYADSCIGCGRCIAVCSRNVLELTPGGVRINIERCDLCGKCSDICYAGALKLTGKKMTVNEVLTEIKKDDIFYRTSGGGVTLSGGECTVHASFATELLKEAHECDIHTAIETCGFCNWKNLFEILKYTDLVLYDIKVPMKEKSETYTGQGCGLILDNLRKTRQLGKKVVIRFPLIPCVNDNDEIVNAVGQIATSNHIRDVHILPFHQMGSSKWHALDRKYICEKWKSPSDEMIKHAKQLLEKFNLFVSVGGTSYSPEIV